MNGEPPRDPLLDAAIEAAEGRDRKADVACDHDQRRVLANLSRLASIRTAFAQLGASERDEPGASMPDAPAPGIPAQWGHLRIGAEIGRGGFGVVYRAFDPVLQRDVALKLRRDDAAAGDAGSYIEEARRLARVRHPNVLAVHGADVDGGRVGLWADLLEGVPLDVELARGALPRSRALAIATQLASALAAIHAAGLVHGDVKAANVMLEPGRAVLMDFGAGGAAGAQPRYGSPATIAPELLEGARATAASDLYSFGALLHHMLLGQLPDRSDPAALRAPLRRRAGRPLSLLVLELLSPGAEQRPDALAVGRRLAAIEGLPQRRRRMLAVALVIASLAIGLALATLGMQRARQAQAQTEQERARAEAVNRFLVDLLAAPQATQGGEQVRVIDVLQQAVDRLESGSERLPAAARAELWQALGRSLDALDRHDDAGAALQRAVDLRTTLHGADDPRTLDSERLYIEAQAPNTDPEGSLQRLLSLHARALAATDDTHPLPHLLAARIGRRYGDLGDQAKARAWLEPAYLKRDQVRWQHPLDRSVVDLEWLFLQQRLGDVEAMLREARQVRAHVEAHAGERHLSAQIARNIEIGALLQQGRLAEAEREAKAMFELAHDWLGEDNALTLSALGSWASAVAEQGRTDEAIALHERKLDISRRRLGPDAPGTLRGALNLANALRASDPARATRLYGEVIAALPERNDMALLARGNLAELQVETGDFAAARETAGTALRLLEESLGEEHLFSAHSRSVLGAAHRGLGDASRALPLLERGAAGLQRYLGDAHLVVLEGRYQLALALLDLGEHARAAELLQGVLDGRRDQLGEAHAKSQAAAAALARARSR